MPHLYDVLPEVQPGAQHLPRVRDHRSQLTGRKLNALLGVRGGREGDVLKKTAEIPVSQDGTGAVRAVEALDADGAQAAGGFDGC